MIDIKNCEGCRDDFYNSHNDLGVTRCWNLPDAKLVQRILVPIDLAPPYKLKAQTVPCCYSKPRHVTVKPESIGADGYWKS